MLDHTLLDKIVGSVERELSRTDYPADFPILPTIPGARYHDPEFFRLETEHVFKKTWLWAAHLSELPETGSYKLFEELGMSVIVSRGEAGEIRAFKNTCRHRGAALLTQPSGKARRFICPYHAWGYALDGSLRSVPEERDFGCLDKAELPLFQVRCEIWRGFVFINFDDDARPLAEFMAPLTTMAGDFPFETMEVKEILTTELDCNWKTAYDNFLEIYHVATVHRKTIAPILNSRSFAPSLLPNGHGCFATKKNGASLMRDVGDSVVDETDHVNLYSIALARHPNALTVLDPSGLNWLTFWPAGPGKTRLMSTLIGPVIADKAQDAEYREMVRIANMAVVNEDVELFATVQRSLDTGDLPAMLVGYQEQCIYWYHEEIDRMIGAERIPQGLAMRQVLEPYLGR